MQHSFNVGIAKQYDIVTAILLDNFFYWTEKNKANGKHLHDGRYWTYNSKKAMADLFPYLTERQIEYAIKKMVEQNIIITGNFSDNKYDRTLWYAITDFGYSILQNCEMYIIYNNTNNKPYIKEINKEKSEQDTLISQESSCKKVSDDDMARWFEKVYSIYPRKVSKVQARKTFEKKICGLDYENAHKKAVAIYKMLQSQIVLWQKENDGQGRKQEHIPYFSSWLSANVEDSPYYRSGRKKK